MIHKISAMRLGYPAHLHAKQVRAIDWAVEELAAQ